MEIIRDQAKDLNVRNYVVYGNTSDKKLYYEAEYTTQVTQEDAEDAFKKGALLIIDGTSMLVPVVMDGTTVKTIADELSLESWSVAASA